MNIITFLFSVSALYLFFYLASLAFLLYSLFVGWISFKGLMEDLLLFSSIFGFFFGLVIEFFNKHKTGDYRSFTAQVNLPYAIASYIVITLLNLGFFAGIFLDVSNRWISSEFELTVYFLIIEGSIGIYTGKLIAGLFDLLNEG